MNGTYTGHFEIRDFTSLMPPEDNKMVREVQVIRAM